MSTETSPKCAHPACGCLTIKDSKYCSQSCPRGGRSDGNRLPVRTFWLCRPGARVGAFCSCLPKEKVMKCFRSITRSLASQSTNPAAAEQDRASEG